MLGSFTNTIGVGGIPQRSEPSEVTGFSNSRLYPLLQRRLPCGLSQPQSSLLSRLWLGVAFTKGYSFLIGMASSPQCDAGPEVGVVFALVRLLYQVGVCPVGDWCQIREARSALVPMCMGGARTLPDRGLEISIWGAHPLLGGGGGTPCSLAEMHGRCAKPLGLGASTPQGPGGEFGEKEDAGCGIPPRLVLGPKNRSALSDCSYGGFLQQGHLAAGEERDPGKLFRRLHLLSAGGMERRGGALRNKGGLAGHCSLRARTTPPPALGALQGRHGPVPTRGVVCTWHRWQRPNVTTP